MPSDDSSTSGGAIDTLPRIDFPQLTSSTVVENADPSGKITHALDAANDATTSTANRVTSPGFTFDNTAKTVPNSQNLSSGSAVGLWLLLTLAANDAALKTTYTSEIDGQTT